MCVCVVVDISYSERTLYYRFEENECIIHCKYSEYASKIVAKPKLTTKRVARIFYITTKNMDMNEKSPCIELS